MRGYFKSYAGKNGVGSFLLLIFFSGAVKAQEPVKWIVDSKPEGQGVFLVTFRAVIANGWHVYSQQQPEEAVATPTKIEYIKNPLINVLGTAEEKGEKILYSNAAAGIRQYQYSGSVEFIQRIKLTIKSSLSTNICGNIHFQTCTDRECLPPQDEAFKITISNTSPVGKLSD